MPDERVSVSGSGAAHSSPEAISRRAGLKFAAASTMAALLPTWISAGCALRAVFAVQWASKELALPFPEQGLRNLPLYGNDLERAVQQLETPGARR